MFFGESLNRNVLLILIMCLTVFSSCYLNAQVYDKESDFLTVPSGNGKSYYILKYCGLKQGNIIVPRYINKKPVTGISQSAFADLELYSVNIPKGIKKIEDWSFSGNFFSDFQIPKSVTEIGAGAFMTNRITGITIPKSVRNIGYRAFCDNPISSVTIGKNVALDSISGYDDELDREWRYVAFELGCDVEFDDFYRQGGSKAGTYILKDGVWSIK